MRLHTEVFLAFSLLVLFSCGQQTQSNFSSYAKKVPSALSIHQKIDLFLNTYGSPVQSDVMDTSAIRLLDPSYNYYFGAFDCDLRSSRWILNLLDSNFVNIFGRDDNWRGYSFVSDQNLPKTCRNYSTDFEGTQLDRGHLAPAKDFDGLGDQAIKESFITTNISPQVGTGFNRTLWYQLEKAARGWAKKASLTMIFTGPIYYEDLAHPQKYIGRVNRIRVPDAFYKIIINISDPAEPKALAFAIENVDHSLVKYANNKVNPKCVDKPTKPCATDNLTNFARHQTTISHIEEVTGLEFVPNMDLTIAKPLKSRKDPIWK